MSALICGSLAYDTIMVFPGRFKDHILPEKVHILSVSFMVPQIRREFGGCAGNIAYNLNLLGGEGFIMATAGQDFDQYSDWIDRCGLSQRYIKKIDGELTAQAFVTTDLDDNQITAFHPGAMNCAHEIDVPARDGISLAIISPDGKEGMMQHARQCSEAGIPFVFDPGQGLPMFNGEELDSFVEQASYVCVNDYESQLLQERTGLNTRQITERVQAMVVTRGSGGFSHPYARQEHRHSGGLVRFRAGSDRMRGCLSRGPDLRIDAWNGLGSQRPDRSTHQCHESGTPWHAKPCVYPGGIQVPVQAGVRLFVLGVLGRFRLISGSGASSLS